MENKHLIIDYTEEGWRVEHFSDVEDLALGFSNVVGDGDVVTCTLRESLPLHNRLEETVNNVDIYYDYGADYYFFVVVGALRENIIENELYWEEDDDS